MDHIYSQSRLTIQVWIFALELGSLVVFFNLLLCSIEQCFREPLSRVCRRHSGSEESRGASNQVERTTMMKFEVMIGKLES